MSEYFNPEVQQQYSDTCAIKSQQHIMEDFGIDVSESDLVQAASEHGWYVSGRNGTLPQDVGKLLELANIPVTQRSGANVFNLMNELAQGHKVIVGVDAEELWHNTTMNEKYMNWYNDFFGPQGGNHALIVAGIDTSDPSNIQVIVKDPGSGEDGKPYPIAQFMDAWSDTQCFMVSTDIPAPKFSDGMENFDQELGHLPQVAGVNYPDFQIFNDISMGLPSMVSMPDGGVMSPIPSLTDAFFDYAENEIDFNQIFSPDYMFNDFLDCNLINTHMIPTCQFGFDNIDWMQIQPIGFDMSNGFDQSMLVNSGVDPDMFFNDCMSQFQALGDFNSMQLCQQQLDIMDYCEHNGFDYYSDFLNV